MLFISKPILVINKPPYEVHETGWGEFEITLKIFFNDPNEKPVSSFEKFN
jgi:YEATS domain-containing protein 4